MEQALYAQEGIVIPGSSFVDNQATLDLLEAKATGVFSMLDEEISVPKGSDEGFLSKVFQRHGDNKHPNMIRPKTKDCQDFLKNFGIMHLLVLYSTTSPTSWKRTKISFIQM
jgi:myosin heavy subunit